MNSYRVEGEGLLGPARHVDGFDGWCVWVWFWRVIRRLRSDVDVVQREKRVEKKV